MTQRIEYRCMADGHEPRELLSPEFAVRVHLRAWAYCPAGAESGHQWERIAATPLHALVATSTLDSDEAVLGDTPARSALLDS